jgi:hypothetical protein
VNPVNQVSVPSSIGPQLSEAVLREAHGRLSDRGIDPDRVLAVADFGEITTARFFILLGRIAATEKAGQGPTYVAARLALRCGLPGEIAETLFLAYNQQSAEEAGHGDKIFGNAYYAMGGVDAGMQGVLAGDGDAAAALLQPVEDAELNRQRLGEFAGELGGIETVALHRVFPNLVTRCEQWDHPIGNDLLTQIRDVVRPEESRHVLLWRYVFHQLFAPKGEAGIAAFMQATNTGRRKLNAPEFDREGFVRLMGTSSPTPRQLLGKDRTAHAG